MPLPRLPRHLRPCRPLWSARQVRFASDKPSDGPSTAGGDAVESARAPEQESQAELSLGSPPGYKAAPPSSPTAKKLRVHSRNGRWRRELLPGQPAGQPADSTGNGTQTSQAQRMRTLLGGGSARNATPQLRIHRHISHKGRTRPMATPRFRIHRQYTAALATHLEEKAPQQEQEKATPQQQQEKAPPQQQQEKAPPQQQQEKAPPQQQQEKAPPQQQQHSGTSTPTEDDLRKKLKGLEAQLALLRAKLAAGNAAESNGQLSVDGGTSEDQAAAVETGATNSTPLKAPDTVDAGQSESRTSRKRPTQTRKKNGTRPSAKPAVGASKGDSEPAEERPPATGRTEHSSSQPAVHTSAKPHRTEKRTLAQQIQARSASMKSSSHAPSARPTPPAPPTAPDELSEQSLLDELFPEASSLVPPVPSDKRPSPPKLDLPAPDANLHIRLTLSDRRTDREKSVDALRARGEQTTVLQLSHCSTALTESDFRRLIPRGRHIDTWSRDGEFYKIIPGRDPLSLARLPFYYLLFHSPASALAYQKNASRLSKLTALYAPSSIASAITPPHGFLEDGEDIAALTASFVLHPQRHRLDLRTVMQPYNRALRALIGAGGYTPIVPNVDDKGRKIHRVLLHIDGYEPSHWDLWQIISRHAYARGIIWPFRNDHAGAVRRLRDTLNLQTVSRQKLQATASANPRAASSKVYKDDEKAGVEYEDPTIASFLGPAVSSADAHADGASAKEVNQLVMNRVYNRWIVEFDDEDAARRFARMWHRVVLPDAKDRTGAWREAEEERWVEAEYLW